MSQNSKKRFTSDDFAAYNERVEKKIQAKLWEIDRLYEPFYKEFKKLCDEIVLLANPFIRETSCKLSKDGKSPSFVMTRLFMDKHYEAYETLRQARLRLYDFTDVMMSLCRNVKLPAKVYRDLLEEEAEIAAAAEKAEQEAGKAVRHE